MTATTSSLQSRRNWPTSRILGASAAALALVLAVLWLLPGLQPRWQPPAAQHTDLANILPALPALDSNSMATHWPQRQNQLLQMQERPLFVLGRKPPPPPPPPQPTTPPETDQWAKATVLGTFAAPSTSGAFVLMEGQSHRVLQGQTLSGWELVSVQPHAIEIRKDGQTKQLPVQKKDISQPSAGDKAPQAAAVSPFAVTPPPAPQAAASAVVAPAATSTPDTNEATTPRPTPKRGPVFGGTRKAAREP